LLCLNTTTYIYR